MKRRILSLLLALCLIVSLLPMAVLAEDTSATDCTSGHTPGAKVELAEQRVNAAIALDEAAGTYSVQPGKYVYQCTCSVCGETYTEEEAFKPALLHYRLSTEDGAEQEVTFSGVWGTGKTAAPQLVINPGQTYYFVTNDTNANHPTNTYVRLLDADNDADKAIIDAGTWNMKFDYPVGRTPVLTMQGATIKNPFGLWYGAYGYNDLAPLTIVLKGDNVINTQVAATKAAALNLRTNSDVTITGNGKLTLQTLSTTPVFRISGGSVELNHTNIHVIKSAAVSSSWGHAFETGAGDIVINGGTFTATGKRNSYEAYTGIRSARNLTIKNGAVVNLSIGAGGGSWGYVISVAGKLTISESTVRAANVYSKSAIKCSSIELVYANGFNAYATNSATSYSTSTDKYTYPTHSSGSKVTELTTTAMNNRYVYIEPKQALEPHDCTAANDDFDCTTPDKCDVCGAFLSSPDITAHTPEADDGNPATPVMCANPGCTQVVIPGDSNAHVCVVHTPGAKVELTEQRVNAAIAKDGETYSVKPGKYVYEYTCAVCGETWTEEEAFKPAFLGFRLSSEDAETVATTFAGVWGSGNTAAPQLVINPGEVCYFVTNDTNSHAGYTYVRQLDANQDADKAIIEAGNWTMKFEYPVGRTPVLTMQGATINNPFGLWYGAYGYNDLAPLTIVLNGNNVIDTKTTTTDGNSVAALNLRTNSDVTITGDGTLTLQTSSKAPAFRISGGSITLNHTNMVVRKSNTSSSGYDHAFTTSVGDIVINGGTFTLAGRSSSYDMRNGLYSARNITIKNGAVVSVSGGMSTSSGSYGLRATNTLTISESSVTTAGTASSSKTIKYNKLVLEYANGFTAYASANRTGYTSSTDKFSPPSVNDTSNKVTEITTTVTEGNKYLSIRPTKALATFTDTAVTLEDDLDVSFRLKADTLTSTDGTVKFTVNGEETELALSQVGAVEGDYYVVTLPGLSAKEMTSEITATIYDAEGNALTETKSDSVQAYALRLLRDEENANDTALKTLLVDMLIYGSMAQVLFCDYTPEEPLPYSALVTAVLTPAEMAYATQDNDMDATPEDPKAIVEGNGYLGTTFELNSNIAMLIAVEGSATSAKVYVDGEYIEDVAATAYEGFVTFTFNGLAAADGRKDVKFEVYTGDTLTVTVTDSLANYVGRMRNDYPYMDELLKYCDAAAAYFTAV